MFRNRFGRRAAVLASAFALAVGSSAAFAQPGPGFGHGRGPGPGFGPGAHIEGVLAQVKTQLALNSSQQQMWDNAVAFTKQARQSGFALMQPVRAAMQAELAKPEPDLAAVAALADDAQAKGQALRKQVRDEWLKVYATFTPQQKAVVRDALAARVQRHEQMAERFRQRAGGQAQ